MGYIAIFINILNQFCVQNFFFKAIYELNENFIKVLIIKNPHIMRFEPFYHEKLIKY